MTEDYTLNVQARRKLNYMLCFHKDSQQVGFFDFNKGVMHFEGDVTESGKLFVDCVLKIYSGQIEAAVAAEREACAKVCEELDTTFSINATWMRERCATAIRARKTE